MIYIELGGSYTDLNGKVFGNYEVKDEQTSVVYLELAKRFETSFGTVDATANVGEVFHDYTSDEFSYGFGLDYYPTNNSKIGYVYQNEEDNILNSYSAQYSYFFVEYVDNLSADTYQANVGVKIAFDDLLDVSTWKAPSNIKPHLSELHKFETMVFVDNMNIRSTNGVEQTSETMDRDDAPADTEAPQLTSTSGIHNENTAEGNNNHTEDYASIVSDNVTVDSNLVINITSNNPELTITKTGTSITFTRTDGTVSDITVTFTFEDEAGNISPTYTQTLLGLDDN